MEEIVEKLYYMKLDNVMTEITVFDSGKVGFVNHTDDIVACAFGVKKSPVSRKELYEFLEDRCFPRTRFDCKRVLKDIDVDFYEPRLIVDKTHGVMFDDTYWVKFEGEDITYADARRMVGL